MQKAIVENDQSEFVIIRCNHSPQWLFAFCFTLFFEQLKRMPVAII
jgi:hypothetical protein